MFSIEVVGFEFRMRRQTVNKLINNFHKAFVYTCAGVTLYGLCVLGLRIGRHFIVVRPQIKEKEKREQALLLQEGRDLEIIEEVAPNIQI